MKKLHLLLLPILLYGNELPFDYHNDFDDPYSQQACVSTTGSTPISAYAAQSFVLWDYTESAPTLQTFQDHYADLLAFCINENISRVVLYPKNPDVLGNPFYTISNQSLTNTNCFAYWINLFKAVNVQVEVFFDNSGFNQSAPGIPVYSLPVGFYFSNLPQKMNWLKSLMEIVPGAIVAVCIDPEGPTSGGLDGYQQVINYIDQYRFDVANNLSNLQNNITFGITAKKMTFANLDTFPTDPAYGTPPPNNYFPTSLPSYRTVGNNVPLCNVVYIQVYEPDFSYLFTQNLAPATAAGMMIKALQDNPYKPTYGTVNTTTGSTLATYIDGGQFVSTGTITCSAGNVNCSYTGTNFATEVEVGRYLDYNQSGTIVPIGKVATINAGAKTFTLVDSTNGANVTLVNQQFILSQFSIEILNGEALNTPANYPVTPNSRIALVNGPIAFGQPNYSVSQHNFTFLGNANYTLSNQQVLCSEVVVKWTAPPITAAIAAGINLLFSMEYSTTSGGTVFFGNWTLSNFMSFVSSFLSQVNGNPPTNPIFLDSDGIGLSLPQANLSIYDYDKTLLINANPLQNAIPPTAPNSPPFPANPWFPQFPHP